MTAAAEARTDITNWFTENFALLSENNINIIGAGVEIAATLGGWFLISDNPENLDDIQILAEDIIPFIHTNNFDPAMAASMVASIAGSLGYRKNEAYYF